MVDRSGVRCWRRRWGRVDIADEVTAEAFSRFLAHRGAPSVTRWQGCFARRFRLMAKELQREKRFRGGAGAEPAAGGRGEFSPELTAALRALSPEQRVAVFLHYYSDMSVSDVAHAATSSPCRATTAISSHSGSSKPWKQPNSFRGGRRRGRPGRRDYPVPKRRYSNPKKLREAHRRVSPDSQSAYTLGRVI